MPKHKKGKAGASASKASKVPYTLILVVGAIVAAAAIYFLAGRDTSETAVTTAPTAAPVVPPEYLSQNPALRNRLILPAIPASTRPTTLPPENFTDDETRRAYQAAKEHPEVLETVACYCGCYGSFGHRNNLDCHKDNHTVT